MTGITTHVLDTARGQGAVGVEVLLSKAAGDSWIEVGRDFTDSQGRIAGLAPKVEAGLFRLRFELNQYFESTATNAFYPYAEVVFRVEEPLEHYHVPLLLSPFGYSTYRGS